MMLTRWDCTNAVGQVTCLAATIGVALDVWPDNEAWLAVWVAGTLVALVGWWHGRRTDESGARHAAAPRAGSGTARLVAPRAVVYQPDPRTPQLRLPQEVNVP